MSKGLVYNAGTMHDSLFFLIRLQPESHVSPVYSAHPLHRIWIVELRDELSRP